MSDRLTLRKKRSKRPAISSPTAPTGPGLGANPTGKARPVQRERAPPSETSDLVKRRYSTRYNQLPQFGLDIPDVPALPGGPLKRRSAGGSPRRPATAQSQHPLTVDQTALADPTLQHENYVKDLLSNASEEDITDYQNSLRRIKHRTSMDLQQSVYQNRTQFIKISKEAERLKGEMSILRGLMSELTTTLSQSTVTSLNSTDGSGAARRAANRSSIANLENMWNVQLQTLWKQVERSQKFLPAVPGRHIVLETGAWIELDSATWKPKRPVHIVLLNDHLLIASKKRKKMDPNLPNQGPAPTKLVAEECWPLQDIDVVDMAANVAGGPTTPQEERAIVTAITVRANNRSLTYRHERRDEFAKNELLSALRKTVEDLRKANMPSQESNIAKRDSLNYFATSDPASASKTEILDSINSSKEKPEVLIEVDGKKQTFRWVEGQIDELDIDIALQKFDQAVDKVETLRSIARNLQTNTIALDLISVKVDERAAKLASILSRDLVDTPSFIEATKRNTNYLIRLGFEDKARDLYLTARGDNLSKRARQCVFDGDLHKYVFSISYVYFTIIRNTATIFQASFPPAMMGACITWANGHLETFNALLVRQLSSVEKEGKVWQDCMDVVWSHEREMLGEVGLDFREVIGRNLETTGSSREEMKGSSSQSRSKSRQRGRA